MLSARRLKKEIKDMEKKGFPKGLLKIGTLVPDSDDVYNLQGCMTGPEGTEYEGGKFVFVMQF